jgi:hypothetical protein
MVLKNNRLEHDDVIRRLIHKRHTVGEVLGGAVSWCIGASFVWNVKRMHRNIMRQKGMKHK